MRDALSRQPFNITLEHIISNPGIVTPISVFHRKGPNLLLAFAVDIDLIGNTRIKVKETFIRFEKKAEIMGILSMKT